MNAYVDNFGLLCGWFRYLEEVSGPLMGNNKNKLLSAVKKLEILPKSKSMCLEATLAGDSIAGFFVKMSSHYFFAGKNDFNIESPFDNFIRLYQETMGEPKDFIIELDTSPAEGLRTALFLDVDQIKVMEVIGKVLAWQGEQKRVSGLRKLVDQARELEPKSVGFMFGKNKMPMRLTFSLPRGEVGNRLDYAPMVELLELSGMSGYKTIEQDLKQLAQYDFLDCRMNLDLLPLGNLNGTVSFDFYHNRYRLEQQVDLLLSENFREMSEMLQRWQVADERIKKLDSCLFFAPISQALGPKEYLVSSLSHFTLRYNRGVRQSAKVCLEAERMYE